MVEYAPIGNLVNKIPVDVWDILEEIHTCRPALMLGELLTIAKLKSLQERSEPERRKNRPLAARPLDPRNGS
jgi:hypothetical protein